MTDAKLTLTPLGAGATARNATPPASKEAGATAFDSALDGELSKSSSPSAVPAAATARTPVATAMGARPAPSQPPLPVPPGPVDSHLPREASVARPLARATAASGPAIARASAGAGSLTEGTGHRASTEPTDLQPALSVGAAAETAAIPEGAARERPATTEPKPSPSLERRQNLLLVSPLPPERAAPPPVAPAQNTAPGSHAGSAHPSAPLQPSHPTAMASHEPLRSPAAATAPAPRAAQPIFEEAQLDPSLHVRVRADGAQLRLDTGTNGTVLAELRLNDGVADVRFSGQAAGMLQRHVSDLSMDLTASGLRPGHLEVIAGAAPTAAQSAADASGDPRGGGGQPGSGQNPTEQDPENEAGTLPPGERGRPAPSLKPIHVEA